MSIQKNTAFYKGLDIYKYHIILKFFGEWATLEKIYKD